ncbi:MAG: dam 1 [Candidatus Brocadiaceae bacterium]|nr:dam 1 [Candidatus Brocadiaceae bacterium]
MITGCLKSPITRIGGKSYLVSWLAGKIPPHKVYVEPFAGAAHLLFGKTLSAVEILNDTDCHLIGFFQVIQEPEKRQALVDRLAFMPYARALWQEIRTRWKQGIIPGDSVQSAAEFFYLNRLTFSGDQKSGGFAVPSTTGRNPAQSYFNATDGLEGIAGRLRGVTIECLDYQECIRRYDSPGTLFYCDPPYLNTEGYYGKGDFAYADHYALARMLNDAKGKVLISHYQDALYDGLYTGWNKYTFESFKGSSKAYSGESKPVTIECLWTNFEARKIQKVLFPGMNL